MQKCGQRIQRQTPLTNMWQEVGRQEIQREYSRLDESYLFTVKLGRQECGDKVNLMTLNEGITLTVTELQLFTRQ